MEERTELLQTIIAAFEAESETYQIKRAMLPSNQDKMLRWMTSSQILDYVAESFSSADISYASVSDMRNACVRYLKSESDTRKQIEVIMTCLTSAGLDIARNPTIVVKLSMLWLIIEGLGAPKVGKAATHNVSYKWKRSTASLSTLYYRLLGTWIHSSTTLDQFQSVFMSQPLAEITPIRWNSVFLSEVVYFLTMLHESGLVGRSEDMMRMNHQRLVSCFVKVNGEAFRNVKQVKNNHRFALSDTKRDAIEALVKQMSASAKHFDEE